MVDTTPLAKLISPYSVKVLQVLAILLEHVLYHLWQVKEGGAQKGFFYVYKMTFGLKFLEKRERLRATENLKKYLSIYRSSILNKKSPVSTVCTVGIFCIGCFFFEQQYFFKTEGRKLEKWATAAYFKIRFTLIIKKKKSFTGGCT